MLPRREELKQPLVTVLQRSSLAAEKKVLIFLPGNAYNENSGYIFLRN